MPLLRKKQAPTPTQLAEPKQTAVELLKTTPGVWRMTEKERMEMTISCRDTDYIKKVKDAGQLKKINGREVQVMFNGLLVENNGYNGEWMSQIIKTLHGHHEPQEEKIFYEVIKRLGPGSTMMELGAFWAYYSLWFNHDIKDAQNICCEPDPANLALGKRNAELNNANLTFVNSAGGSQDKKMTEVMMESEPRPNRVPIRSVDGLMAEYGWKKLDLLHMDIQGFELDALDGALNTIQAGKLRFLFVSTHHYLISDNPNTHGECLDFIRKHGGTVIASHTVPESFSGDGLIVASFDKADADFKVETSLNHSDGSLFRSSEEDVAILAKAYDALRT